MADQGWLSLFTAALGGGVTVKAVDILHQEYRGWRTRYMDDTRSTDASLEPLLRAADELVGKLRSLAEQDFLPLRGTDASSLEDMRLASVLYLFVQFWSEVEIVRFRGLSTAVARSNRGRRTREFLICLESRRVRLIDRISQRALGEAALREGRTMNFVEFVKHCEADAHMSRWLRPLSDLFARIQDSDARQRVIQYATVLHAFIDTVDAKHLVTKNRPATPNKLNAKSWKDLNYRVFDVYLTFVKDRSKYIGPPKRRP